jgi:peptidoglycan/LPS O-acetylase OafA/YrhL
LTLTLTSLIAAALPLRLLALHSPFPFAVGVMLPCRMDSLFLGVLLAWAMRDEDARSRFKQHNRKIFAALTASFLYLLWMCFFQMQKPEFVFGYTAAAIFFASTIALIFSNDIKLPGIFTSLSPLGLGAYSIYLFHLPILIIFAGDRIQHTWREFILASALCALVALFFWTFVEAPLIRLGHRAFRYSGKLSDSSQQPLESARSISGT